MLAKLGLGLDFACMVQGLKAREAGFCAFVSKL